VADITVKVESAVLRAAADNVSTLARALGDDFDRLQDLVRLTNRYWLGAAGDQYRQEFAEEKKQTDEILTLLREYPKDLLTMAGLYEEAERTNIQTSSALPSDIL